MCRFTHDAIVRPWQSPLHFPPLFFLFSPDGHLTHPTGLLWCLCIYVYTNLESKNERRRMWRMSHLSRGTSSFSKCFVLLMLDTFTQHSVTFHRGEMRSSVCISGPFHLPWWVFLPPFCFPSYKQHDFIFSLHLNGIPPCLYEYVYITHIKHIYQYMFGNISDSTGNFKDSRKWDILTTPNVLS